MSMNDEIEKLEKEFAISQAVAKNNMKWGAIAVAIILSFLGYNSFVALPADAKKSSR
jgi:hypothetical protein